MCLLALHGLEHSGLHLLPVLLCALGHLLIVLLALHRHFKQLQFLLEFELLLFKRELALQLLALGRHVGFGLHRLDLGLAFVGLLRDLGVDDHLLVALLQLSLLDLRVGLHLGHGRVRLRLRRLLLHLLKRVLLNVEIELIRVLDPGAFRQFRCCQVDLRNHVERLLGKAALSKPVRHRHLDV